MTTKLLFDTLNYARILKDGGVENADIHASSLVTALSQNIYTKDEVDVRIERAIHHFEETINKRFGEVDKRFSDIDKRFAEIDNRFTKVELHMEKMMNRNLIATVSIIGGLMAIMQTVLTFAHNIFH